MSPQDLCDIEEIKQLKARYLRFGDTKQIDEFEKLFTEDVSLIYIGVPRAGPEAPSDWTFEGRDQFIRETVKAWPMFESAHQAYLPEIAITGPTTAKGIWGIHDYLVMPHCIFRAWGHYHEDYRKVDGAWKISKLRLSRLRVEETWL